jgi:hypothetical protein
MDSFSAGNSPLTRPVADHYISARNAKMIYSAPTLLRGIPNTHDAPVRNRHHDTFFFFFFFALFGALSRISVAAHHVQMTRSHSLKVAFIPI